jgi:hypothetical protein
MARVRDRLSYANVVATLALFVAMGGTSYAVIQVGSADIVDNSVRSRDIRNSTARSRDIRDGTIRARDVRRDSLGAGVIKESTLGVVPRSTSAERIGGATAQDLRLRCPAGTVPAAGVCIEIATRPPDGFLGAINRCDQAGRGLATMPELDAFLRANGPLGQAEWTSSVYRNTTHGPDPFDQLEAVLLASTGNVSYDRVYLAVQHAFRCVALPSN